MIDGDAFDLDDPGGVGICWGGALDGAATERAEAEAGAVGGATGAGLLKRESSAFCLSCAADGEETEGAGGDDEDVGWSSFKDAGGAARGDEI